MVIFRKSRICGISYLGLLGLATDKFCIIPISIQEKEEKPLLDLGVPLIKANIADSSFIGIFLAGNSKKIIFPNSASKEEVDLIKKQTGAEVLVLEDSINNALGNLILINDNGAILSPDFPNKISDQISKFLGVPTKKMKIAGSTLVGSVAYTTNKGCLLHRDATEKEAEIIKQVLNVEVIDVGSANFGSPFVHSGLCGNSKAVIIGDLTSGPELTRIFEVFN